MLFHGTPPTKAVQKSTSSTLAILTLLDEGLEAGLESKIYILWWTILVMPITPPVK